MLGFVPTFGIGKFIAIFVVTFRHDTMPFRQIYHYRRVPTWHAACPAYLLLCSDTTCRLSGIFIITTLHVGFVTASQLSCRCGQFVVADSSSMTEPTSGGIQPKRRNRKLPLIPGAAVYISGAAAYILGVVFFSLGLLSSTLTSSTSTSANI